MKDTDKYTDRDWEELAARFSGERQSVNGELEDFTAEDNLLTEKHWKEIRQADSADINIDNAWNRLHKKLGDNGLLTKTISLGERNRSRFFLRIAATVLIIAGLGTAALYIGSSGVFAGKTVVVAGNDSRGKQISLPDGSKVWLNRNSELSYKNNPGKATRNVRLKGEAFFDIEHDASRPFTIDAGKAKVKVIGTSFNVITSNPKDEVEVYVKTGTVMLTDQSGARELILEPGYVGIISSAIASKSVNANQNYLSWKTDLLVYNGETLGNVFGDLKKVFNINVVADDPAILGETISTTFDKLPQDTIISIICTTFNFRYQKEGKLYHLSKK